MRFILNGPAVAHFTADADVVRFLVGMRPFLIRRRDDTLAIPPAWDAVIVRSFTSFADMERAFARDAIGTARAILYDNEAWEFTPEAEQRDPGRYTEAAARLARERGLAFIAAPAVNLTRAGRRAFERPYDAYLRLGLAASSARNADVYVVQAQGSERAVPRYASFVRSAARQARAANARVLVFAGISTNPSGQRVSADAILRAIDAVRDEVDGFWFNVPHPGPYCPKCNDFRPDLAIDVVRQLAAR